MSRASDPPARPVPSWRSRPRAAPRRSTAGPRWRAAGAARGGRPRSKLGRFAALAAAATILVGLLTWVVFWLRIPPGVDLVLAGSGYQQNLAIPHNAHGLNGLKAVKVVADGLRDDSGLRLAHEEWRLAGAQDLTDILGRRGRRTTILVLALHGAADERGPFLLLDAPAGAAGPAPRVYLEEIVDRLAAQAPRRFVLVLDPAQEPAMPLQGVLHNDFAAGMQDGPLHGRIERATNLVVLCGSGAGQRSWVSDLWHRTVFAHYLAEGLGGAADGDGDGRITALDLWRYTHRRVERWAFVNRGMAQTPLLIPAPDQSRRAASFELALVPRRGPASAAGTVAGPIPARWDSEWARAWAAYRDLREAAPSPAVYSPRAWRRYVDWLLRYDELVRADDDAAAEVRKTILALGAGIVADRTRRLGSERNSLAMPAATGVPLPDESRWRDAFNPLWDDPASAEAAPIAGLDAGKARAFAGLLIGRVADSATPDALGRARRLLPLLARPGDPLPAELNYLAALLRDAPGEPADAAGAASDRDRIARALRLRLQAERAALGSAVGAPAYAEYVTPHLAAATREADDHRRKGEDLVLADDPESRTMAGVYLGRAEGLYRQIEERAARLRAAVEARDEALADLPFCAEWAARLPSQPKAGGDRSEQVAGLFQVAHDLDASLRPGREPTIVPSRAGEPSAPDAEAIKGLVEKLKPIADLRRATGTIAGADDADYWSIAAALATPFPGPDERRTLLKDLERRSAGSDEDRGLSASERADASAAAAKEGSMAVRRVRLAVAAMGRDWFDRAAIDPEPSPVPGRALDVAESGEPSSTSDPATGRDRAEPLLPLDEVKSSLGLGQDDMALPSREALAEAGVQIGSRWWIMARAIRRGQRSAALAGPGAITEDLDWADRLARRIPGGVGDGPDAKEAPDARDAYRGALLQRLLIHQARRALGDHYWSAAGAPDGGRPYYTEAGGRFLDDADKLLPRREDGGEVGALREALKRVEPLTVAGPGPLEMTTERARPVEFAAEVAPGSSVPAGYPVAWLVRDPAGLIRVVHGGEARHRLAVEGGAAAADRRAAAAEAPPEARFRAVLDFPLIHSAEADPAAFPRPEARRTNLVLESRYRGQVLRVETAVAIHPVPERAAVRYPPPSVAKVAVRADEALIRRFGEGGGGLAIVLDCSRSMETKYKEATDSLRQVLGNVAAGTQVSLWVFGEQLQPGDTADDAERTITRLLPPTPWRAGDPQWLAGVMALVEPPALKPWNQSPIVRAMIQAREDLRDVAGPKTLLVITDGKDNRFEAGARTDAEKGGIAAALRDAFAASDIEIDVVGYKVVGAEEDEARNQFRTIEGFRRPGRFFSTRRPEELADALSKALRPSLRAAVETVGNEVVRSLSVGSTGADWRWSEPGLPPGGYRLVAGAGERIARDITLNRGDLLLLQLAGRGTLDLERVLFTDDLPQRPWNRESAGWRLSVVRNGRPAPAGDGLELWTTLEKLPVAGETSLEMIRPREAWLEVEPQEAEGPAFAQRWAYQAGLPAASWAVRVPAWAKAGGARPLVRAWWDPYPLPASAPRLLRFADYDSAREIPARPFRVGGETVVVEGVAAESRRVEVAPGRYRDDQPCLVVRLRYEAEDRPFFARPEGIDPAGVEHRFYTKARRYTGIFWPVTEDQMREALRGLELVSLAEFKAQAARRGHAVALPVPVAPDPTDHGPSLLPFVPAPPEPLAPSDAAR